MNPDWLGQATVEQALKHGLTEDEYNGIREALGREVNLLELGICSALYSEHCSYKSTKVHLKTLPTEGPRVIQGPGENAGVVDIGDNQAVVFKVESHNHPSFIEPYQGAATGVGGILRDVFTMGARPLALMNGLRFGALENSRTKYLLSRAVAGIGNYGNCMGIPTVGGELFFHRSFNGNCLVNAFALGLVDHDKVFLGTASGVGNSILYVGSKTGRDGIHGATMASESFGESSEEKRPTVQVGDPFQEKLLLEACLEAMATGAIIGIQDMGAAGMTSSSFEMAERAHTGVRLDLSKVPQREEGMNPYEIMLSESQERMLLVVESGKEETVTKIFEHWELDAVKIGEVIESEDVELYWNGELVSALPVEVLTRSVPVYRWPEADAPEPPKTAEEVLDLLGEQPDFSQTWLDFLGSVNICSRQDVYGQYDSTVRTNTVIHPGGDAAVIRVKRSDGGPEKGVAMTLDCNSRYCAAQAREGAALSVVEACRNIAAVGAHPIGISDCLNFGSPEKPEGMRQIAEGIRGIGEAARAFRIPVVSGNASLYNETEGRGIYPTPTIAMVGLIDDVSKCVPAHFRKSGDAVLVLGKTNEMEMGVSEYLAWKVGYEGGEVPRIDYDLEMKTADLVRSLINERLIRSCHDVSSGGLAIAFAECCLGRYESIGASLKIEQAYKRADALLYAETGARYVLSCAEENVPKIRQRAETIGLSFTATGTVGGNKISIQDVGEISLETAHHVWSKGLREMFD